MLDDYSRFILAWGLKTDMTAASISELVEQAVEWAGMRQVPVEDHTRLVSDNWSSCLSHAFEDYLRMLQIWHIRCSPHLPQPSGKLERFHETSKARLNLLVSTSPEHLRVAMAEFIKSYSHSRYHERIGNVTPADVYYGRREGILKRKEEQHRQTLYERFQYNHSRTTNRATGESEAQNRSLSDRLNHSQRC